MASFPVECQQLYVPELSEVASVFKNGLSKNFQTVKVDVVQCPDLTQEPFNLVAPGLGGSPRVAELGGVPYLMPTPDLSKSYSLDDVAKMIELPDAFIVGAGAGPHTYVGVNSEMITHVVTGSSPKNGSRIAKIDPEPDSCKLETLPLEERRCSLMQNMFACVGKPGTVIRVRVQQRTGEDNFVSCMRKALAEHFGANPVGVGGVFRITKGKAKCHVMPKFSDKPLTCEDDVNNWLKFFNFSAPLMFMSVFVSSDPGLDLRLEHSHGYGPTCGGHYHYDVTPEEVEYEGYFNIGEKIYRIDRPQVTHNIGRN